MRYEATANAVAMGDSIKSAALFYDNVFPILLREDMPGIMDIAGLSDQFLHSLLPEGGRELGMRGVRMISGWALILDGLDPNGERNDIRKEEFERLFADYQVRGNPIPALTRNLPRYNFEVLSAFALSRKVFSGRTDFVSNGKARYEQDGDPSLLLTGLSLVDVNRLSWEQILEIRNDVESRKKLQRLRTFVFEVQDKPIAYVEDILGNAIEEYRAAAEKHSAQVRNTVLAIGASEKFLTGALSGILATMAGVGAPVSAALGASTVIAGTLLEVRAIRNEYRIDSAQCPVRFLVDLNEACSSDQEQD
jgi:hypothetical protein